MKYIKFIRENLDGYRLVNGLRCADLGYYKDRRIWLFYHPQDSSKTQIAIEYSKEGQGRGCDIVTYSEIPKPKVKKVQHVHYVDNLDVIKPYCVTIAKFMYDMDNDPMRFK